MYWGDLRENMIGKFYVTDMPFEFRVFGDINFIIATGVNHIRIVFGNREIPQIPSLCALEERAQHCVLQHIFTICCLQQISLKE
jgi:hypothetical protein